LNRNVSWDLSELGNCRQQCAIVPLSCANASILDHHRCHRSSTLSVGTRTNPGLTEINTRLDRPREPVVLDHQE
jgi:hypothetical protein